MLLKLHVRSLLSFVSAHIFESPASQQCFSSKLHTETALTCRIVVRCVLSEAFRIDQLLKYK